jgi:hypothetical protein
LLPGHEEIVELLKDSENNPDNSFIFKDWQPWSIFGTYIYQLDYKIGRSGITDQRFLKEEHYLNLVTDAFYKSTGHFLNYYKLDLPEDWQIMGPSFSRYDKTVDVGNGLAMRRHTDYQPWERENPGYKFALTCTMYLNDDYEGGEISFKIKDKTIDYKPKAGEIIVFPSGNPDFLCEDDVYLHGVKKMYGEDRYLIRCFYQFYDPGSKRWHKNKEKYGEDVWNKMEEERMEREAKSVLQG